MTNIETLLIIILWVITGIWLGWKWDKANSAKNPDGAYILSIALCPIVLIITIIRQVFFEDWN